MYTDLDAARAGVLAQQEILAQAMPQAVVGAETPYHANGSRAARATPISSNTVFIGQASLPGGERRY